MKKFGLFLGPIVFTIILLLPAPAPLSAEAWKVLALASLMLIWWITEALPLPTTALLPIVLLPLMKVSPIKVAAAPYSSPIIFLFMGGFMVALAMEKWKLHRRIALNIVKRTGTNANGIILGFMLATAFLSMWISNTATAVMMLPIAMSMVDILKQTLAQREDISQKGTKAFALTLMLGIAYAANIGGTATIIGTPPNVVFQGFIEDTYGVEVSFAKWLMIGVPFAAIMLMMTYFLNVYVLNPNRLGHIEGAGQLIDQELEKLGPMSSGEKRTMYVFIGVALTWTFAKLLNTFLPFKLGNSEIALLATFALFIIPAKGTKDRLLNWADTQKLAWGILLIFGGGLSLAAALESVGIVKLIGDQFAGYTGGSFLIILGLTAVSLFLTEVMSNVALVSVFLPVVGGIAVGIGLDPLMVCIPVTLAASCAFMLPVSTPPNAIVFSSGFIEIKDMMRSGVILNIITIILVALLAEVLLPWVLG